MSDFSYDPLTLIRILCGLWFLPHCFGKIFDIKGASITFEEAGFKPVRPFVYFTLVLELIVVAGLVFGIYEKVAAGLAVLILLGAAAAVIKINGFLWIWQKKGTEYLLFWSLVCILSVSGS
jgi:putative oxidoreductase